MGRRASAAKRDGESTWPTNDCRIKYWRRMCFQLEGDASRRASSTRQQSRPDAENRADSFAFSVTLHRHTTGPRGRSRFPCPQNLSSIFFYFFIYLFIFHNWEFLKAHFSWWAHSTKSGVFSVRKKWCAHLATPSLRICPIFYIDPIFKTFFA